MMEAPKQDWQWYEAKCRDEHRDWLRGLTQEQSWRLYKDLHRLAASQADGSAGLRDLEQRHWEDKVALRTRMRHVFAQLDRIDPDAAITTFTYDSGSGRMTVYRDPLANLTTFTYNFAGRATTVTRPDSATETLAGLQLQSLCDTSQCTSGLKHPDGNTVQQTFNSNSH